MKRQKKKKPGKTGKSKPKRSGYRYIGFEEANRMFAFFCEVRGSGGMTAIAKQFHRARSSVIRACKKYHWQERREDVERKTVAGLDDKIAAVHVSNIEVVKEIKDIVIKRLREKAKAKGGMDVSVRDALATINAEEELLDKMPDTGKDIEVIPEVLKEALEVLKEAGTQAIAAIGDMIVMGKLTKEKLIEE